MIKSKKDCCSYDIFSLIYLEKSLVTTEDDSNQLITVFHRISYFVSFLATVSAVLSIRESFAQIEGKWTSLPRQESCCRQSIFVYIYQIIGRLSKHLADFFPLSMMITLPGCFCLSNILLFLLFQMRHVIANNYTSIAYMMF